ncbi:uncharacterized protein LOC135819092 [Sycon ciliatum]|uniref:uncharacterized protein LOC135819092 n=1 Tax=Sycon ciliatum TaxID=27933 RepID=UPI0020ABD9CF
MGSCLARILRKNRDPGYERATRNAEDAFDSDSDTDEPLLRESETPASSGAGREGQVVPKLLVESEYHDDDSGDEGAGNRHDDVDGDEQVDQHQMGDMTAEAFDALATAALEATVKSLVPELDTPVPANTPADGNLLDL